MQSASAFCASLFSGSSYKDKEADFEAELESILSSMHLKVMDHKITEIVRSEKKLAGCRSLDALHLATALYYKNHGPEDFFIATFDQEMAITAKKIGLSVLDFESSAGKSLNRL